ncbi:MAG: iron ABC transporter permease [Ardenticatenaceae bacterium]|nr:iron ABC transporter permease [Ardenticatenaceae bacterium]MCB8989137.1 iron ABC transporter permease [Ardenticatenaceae bacterium]
MKRLLYSLPILFLALFYFYPLAAILRLSFAPQGAIDWAALRELVGTDYYLQTLWFTTWQAAVSTLLVLLLALPGAYVFARYRFRGKQTLQTISTLPFVLPTVVVANAFTALLGPNGLLNGWLMRWFHLAEPPIQLQFTIWMILLAHVFYNYSVALRIITTFWQNLGDRLPQAANMLGASPWRAFWTITWPLLRPAVLAAALLVFIFCFTSFGVVLILGGPQFATLEVEIYRQAANLFNLPVAAALSLLQIVFTFVLMALYTRSQANMIRPLTLQSARHTAKPIQNGRDRLIVTVNLGVMLVLLALPLSALLLRSISGQQGLTLRFYRELFINRQGSLFFVPPGTAVFNSMTFALVAMSMAVALGLLAALMLTQKPKAGDGKLQTKLQSLIANSLDPLFMLPLATSAVTLGFGYIITMNKPPLNLRSSLALVPIAHTLVATPFVIRSVLPAMRSIRPSLREAAAILGANPRQVWWHVEWPLLRRALLVGAVFAFTVSMGEFGATVFIARPQTPTLPVAIYRFLGQPGALNYGQALAMSSLLLLVCAVGFVAIERFRLGTEGEF